MITLPTKLLKACRSIEEKGGRAYLVGGCLRDHMLGLPQSDYDFEAHGIDGVSLMVLLACFGTVNTVGVSFGVLKLKTAEGLTCDFSLPRRETKTGEGHRDFAVDHDPSITLAEASARRDFTVNSMMYDPLSGILIDHHGGVADLDRRVLRHTSEHFDEDPLRVLRGMQFAARFSMKCHGDLGPICSSLSDQYHTIPRERVFGEWCKWAASDHPSYGLDFLVDTEWVKLYPCLLDMIGLQQSKRHHPEGDVWVHSRLVCDAMADICKRENVEGEDRTVLMLAALLHDVGKSITTVFGKKDSGILKGDEHEVEDWRSPGHAEVGVPIAREFLEDIGCFPRIIDRVLPLVAEHMIPVWQRLSKRAARRLVKRLGPATLGELYLVMEADNSGRHPKPGGPPAGSEQLLEMVVEDVPSQVVPILRGRDLLKLGWQPGPDMGRVLDAAEEAQLDGAFDDLSGAIAWVKANAGAD